LFISLYIKYNTQIVNFYREKYSFDKNLITLFKNK